MILIKSSTFEGGTAFFHDKAVTCDGQSGIEWGVFSLLYYVKIKLAFDTEYMIELLIGQR